MHRKKLTLLELIFYITNFKFLKEITPSLKDFSFNTLQKDAKPFSEYH